MQATPADPLPLLVRETVSRTRLGNAIVLGWFRVALRTATLLLQGWLVIGLSRPLFFPPLLINLAHLALGAVVLRMLRQRRAVETGILLGAASDFTVVFIGAARAVIIEPGNEISAVYFMALLELMLLFAALTLPAMQVAGLGGLCFAFTFWMVRQAGLNGADSAFVLVTLAAFGAVAAWAGTRVFGLAVRTAMERHAAVVERRHSEELESARSQLLAAQSEAETLAQLVVHDLRNPLGALRLNIDEAQVRLEREPGSAEGAAALQLAKESVRRLEGMIAQLLLISRLEGGAAARRQPVDVRSLLDDVAAAFSAAAERAGAHIGVQSPPGPPANLDPALIRRMLDNLVANALRQVGRGDRIELAAETAGDRLTLAVRNSGPVIPEHERERIFDKNVSGSSPAPDGAGLGLYLCRLVASAHGGQIALSQRPGWNVSFEAQLGIA